MKSKWSKLIPIGAICQAGFSTKWRWRPGPRGPELAFAQPGLRGRSGLAGSLVMGALGKISAPSQAAVSVGIETGSGFA